MRIYLSHNSALYFWRQFDEDLAYQLEPLRIATLSQCSKAAFETRELLTRNAQLIGSMPHLLVPHSDNRVLPRTAIYHVYNGPLPQRSFYRVTENIAVAGPEFCFAQMANTLTLNKLIMYADELCGTYSIRMDLSERFITRKQPLTSVTLLGQFMNALERFPGLAKARRALKFAVDGSASPAETKMELCLGLSKLLGGAAFPKPVMNYEIVLPPKLARMARKSRYRCDLAWPNQNVGLEYNSARHHTENVQVTADDIRRNILEYTGMQIIIAKPHHLYTYDGFSELEAILAKAIGKRLVPLTDSQKEKRLALRSELF